MSLNLINSKILVRTYVIIYLILLKKLPKSNNRIQMKEHYANDSYTIQMEMK